MDNDSAKDPIDAVEQNEYDARVSDPPYEVKPHDDLPGYTRKSLQKNVQKKANAEVEKSKHETTRENVVHDLTPLLELAIPETALEIPVKAMMEGLRKRGFYDGTRWVDWKDEMSEQDYSEFFNKLADAVDEIIEEHKELSRLSTQLSNTDGDPSPPKNHHPRRKPRRWTHEAMDQALPGDPSLREPDLVCIDEGEEKAWPFVQASGQCTSSSLRKALNFQRRGYGATKRMFCSQHNRRFVIGCTIANDSISFHYIDRSGMLSSGLYEVHKHPEQFVRIIVGFTLIDPKYLGYDTTLSVVGGVGKVTFEDKEYEVLENIYTESSVLGRGTMCFEVKHPDSNSEQPRSCVLKDAWVDVRTAEKEVVTLKKLNELKITNIPTVVASGLVKIDGRVDSTKDIRVALMDLDSGARGIKPLPKTSLSGDSKANAPTEADGVAQDKLKRIKKRRKVARNGTIIVQPIRDHHRIILEPYGIEFYKFRCLEEFILAIKDIISGAFVVERSLILTEFGVVIKQLYDNHYLHRDISINNIVLAERAEDAFQKDFKRLQGFLIDFDFTIFTERDVSDARAEVTVRARFSKTEPDAH